MRAHGVVVSLIGGTGSGDFSAGERIFVQATDASSGQVFDHWSGDTSNLLMADSPITTLLVPSSAVSILANYRAVGPTTTTIDSSDYINLTQSNFWVHAKSEYKTSGETHVTTNTTICLGEQLFNGTMAHAIEELMNDQPFETAYYGLSGNSAFIEGTYNSDNGGMTWADGNEVVFLTNSFTDGLTYNLNCAFAHEPGNLIPYTLCLIPGETVTVPAGTFTCVRSQVWIPMFEWFNEEWYAPGVGKVKAHSSEIGNGEYVWELLSYGSGGPPVENPPQITTTTLPVGSVKVPYSATLTATNGTPPYSWEATGLPGGLSISTDGVLSGTPIAAFSNLVSFAVTDSAVASNSASVDFEVRVDADNDSIPDAWEYENFGHVTNCVGSADADGDGRSNYEEYITGMNPTNRSSVMTLSITNSAATNGLSWYGISNRFYQLEYTADLSSTNWVPVDYSVMEGTNGMMMQSDAGTISNRFYRVKVSDDAAVFPEPPSDALEGMVLIPAGTNSGTDPDFGLYSLTVDAFYMDATEVTKAQWDEVYTWAVANGYSFDRAGTAKGLNHPVTYISWYDCAKWSNAKSEMNGLVPCYTVSGSIYRIGQINPECDLSASGFRLPTTDEWQYASRGGLNGKRFPWGDTITHEQANYKSDSSQSYDISSTRGYHPLYENGNFPYSSPVGSFAANAYGLYDMSGNVMEWCWDVSGMGWNAMGGYWADNNYIRCGKGIPASKGNIAAAYGFRVVRR